MVQREVAERMIAVATHQSAYGAVTVKVAYWATATNRWLRAGDRVRPPTQGGKRTGRNHPPAATGGYLRRDGAVRPDQDQFSTPPQDARGCSLADRVRRTLRTGGHCADGCGPRNWTYLPGGVDGCLFARGPDATRANLIVR